MVSFRRDMEAARQRLSSMEFRRVETPFGAVEYADRGEGPAVLVVHGVTQGADGGLESLARGWVPMGFRLVVPSRFGYLGSEFPPDATPEMQADAFAALLDAVGLKSVCVLAGSAGSTSAIQFTLRHRSRTQALLLISPNVPGPHQGRGAPRAVFKFVFSHDFVLWLFRTCLPGTLAKLIGIPKGLPLTAQDKATLAAAMDGVFPARPRAAGVLFDTYVSNPAINAIPLSEVRVPTLVVHARDDAGPPYECAVTLAGQIAGARLLTIERGGHLMLGDHSWANKEVADFLRRHSGAIVG